MLSVFITAVKGHSAGPGCHGPDAKGPLSKPCDGDEGAVMNVLNHCLRLPAAQQLGCLTFKVEICEDFCKNTTDMSTAKSRAVSGKLSEFKSA